jgi:hypothetical protein
VRQLTAAIHRSIALRTSVHGLFGTASAQWTPTL